MTVADEPQRPRFVEPAAPAIEEEEHGGAWKVAYADLTTALMALFIVLWILNQPDELKASVANYFQNPAGDGILPEEAAVLKSPPDAAEGLTQPEPPPSRKTNLDEGGTLHGYAQTIFDRVSKANTGLAEQMEFAVTKDGLRISLVELADSTLFPVGGTTLNPKAEQLVAVLAEELHDLNNEIMIEGHTDSRSFDRGSDRSNWELSAGRANRTRQILEQGGVAPERIVEVKGLADRQLYNVLDPFDSRNRRIAITIMSPDRWDPDAEQEVEVIENP